MARLTRRGHSISSIAGLELSRLRELLLEHGPAKAPTLSWPEAPETNRILLVGAGLGPLLRGGSALDLEILPVIDHVAEALRLETLPDADLLVVELDSFFTDTRRDLEVLRKRCKARRALVVFRFASRKDLNSCRKVGGTVSLLQAPVDGARLRRECYMQLRVMQVGRPGSLPLSAQEVPERLIPADDLLKLARIGNAVNCECPRDLCDIITALCAFESYSASCEDRNADDAVVHAYLHRTTALARRTMEEALGHLLRAEGVSITSIP